MMTVQPEVDIDEYLAALPVRSLSAPRNDPPSMYQVSRGPLLKYFNGFSGVERRRGGQLAAWLLAAGCIALPSRCEICGSKGPLALHGEVYYDVTRDPALCRRCHMSLHLRPYRWTEWRKIVDTSAITGREWFALAPPNGADIAGYLRMQWGWAAADLVKSPIRPLPDVIAEMLPGNMLDHPELR